MTLLYRVIKTANQVTDSIMEIIIIITLLAKSKLPDDKDGYR